jgi:tyrosine-protein phosphatase non-receptor type 14/21
VKLLVMEGQLTCLKDQAVLVASHAVQSEFGDHDSDKYTVEFYGEYILFPPSLVKKRKSRFSEK